MAEIMDVIRSHLDRETLEGLGKRVGADPSTVQRVVAMALPLLVGGLSRNVGASPQGRSSLNAALERDHDGSLLDRLGSLLGGGGGEASRGALGGLAGAVGGLVGDANERAQAPRAADGDGILRHVLGDRREVVEDGTARASGLDRGAVGSIMTALAPMLMSALGKVKRDRGLDEAGVTQLVESERRDLERATPEAHEGDLLRVFDEASGGGDVATWADRLGSALGGSLTGRKEPPG
jgi:hypothetical protein